MAQAELIPKTSKWCTGPCGKEKLVTEFYEKHDTKSGRRFSQCKECHGRYQKEQRQKFSLDLLSARLKRRYGISLRDREKLILSQGGKCKVCRKVLEIGSSKFTPVVDHDHRTGHVRGIICKGCNTAEGLLGSVKVAIAMAAYMQENEIFYHSND